MPITILCALPDSIYKTIPGLDVWDKERNAYNYRGRNPIIAHPPCAQWSKLKSFAHKNEEEKELGILCVQLVTQYGGIVEQPQGSTLFDHCRIPQNQIYSVDQSWFNYPAKKTTWLYYNKCKPAPMPILHEPRTLRQIQSMDSKSGIRSRTTIEFANWLIKAITLPQ